MKKIILLITIGLTVNGLFAQASYSKEVEDQIKQVENDLRSWIKFSDKAYNITERMAYYKVKGLSMAVVHDYKIVWAKGYGWADEKEKRPVTVNTLFQAASNSKSINGVGVLKLVQDKKLDLYTDINTYLRSWKFPYDSLSKSKKITLAHLLSHTAGLRTVNFPGYDRNAKLPTIPQILDGKDRSLTKAVRSEFEPGLRSQYSGGGTTITRLIMEDVTGQPYDRYMYDNVLKPLGMLNSFFTQPPPEDKLNMLATGYYADGSEVKNKFKIYPEQAPDGLWTTPSEMCNYIIETQLAYEGRSSKVLTPEMTRLRLTPYIDKNAALGVFIQEIGGIKYFSHGAGNEGFSGYYIASLQGGNGVVVYINSNSDNLKIIQEVVNSVATVYKWKDFCDTIIRKEITVPESVLEKYIGVYLAGNDLAYIFKKPDGYYYHSGELYGKMHFTSDKIFFNKESPTEKRFEYDATGNVIGFSRKAFGQELPFAVKITRPDTLYMSSDKFGNIAWEYIESKKYPEAVAYCKRGLQFFPDDEVLIRQLAYAYLFNGDYEDAKAIFTTQLKQIWKSDSNWKNTMQQVLIYFKNNGYNVQVFDKLFDDLKIKKPKG